MKKKDCDIYLIIGSKRKPKFTMLIQCTESSNIKSSMICVITTGGILKNMAFLVPNGLC